MNKYYRNFILCGNVDHYCLLCDETYTRVEDVDKHIRWENHRKILKAQTYFPKFRKNGIFKLGPKFYCEFCNILIPGLEDANTHIKTGLHITNKMDPFAVKEKVPCKKESGYVIVSDIIVTMEEWNSVIDNHCMICDEPVAVLSMHAKSKDHLVKLIQSNVVMENEDRCYREINPQLVYCFMCKKTVPTETLSGHWESKEHNEKKNISINRTSKSSKDPKRRQKEAKKRLIEIQKILYNINLKHGTATCKQCEKVIKFHFNEMKEHQDAHKTEKSEDSSDDEAVESYKPKTAVIDHGKKRAEVAKYGRKHNIKLNAGGSKGYCFICHIHISAHVKVVKEHIKGCQHIALLEYKGVRKETDKKAPVYTTEPLAQYLKSVFHSISFRVLWVNSLFCIDQNSFLLVAPVQDLEPPRKMMCLVCNVEYKIEDNYKHLRTGEHKTHFMEADVVIMPREFIREVAENLFHCGFCNRLIAYFENVSKHIRSSVHRFNMVKRETSSSFCQKWLNESVIAILGPNPDIMYLQLLGEGVASKLPAHSRVI